MSISNPTIGEITMFGGNFAPRGWAFCDGQSIAISQFSSLFSILGTTYGGDGRSTFALPDMRGRFPLHAGQGPGLPSYQQGQKGGYTSHTLTELQMPTHNHAATLHGELAIADKRAPQDNMLALTPADAPIYAAPVPAEDRTMAAESVLVQNAGGNQPFNMMNPYGTVQFIIALEGIYPSRS